jgi:pSer/pThr/pTyr-binding forkhead associated (FHA) protein
MAGSQGFLVDDQLKVAHQLTAPTTRIGRDASNDIVVRDPTASRFHAEVRREESGFVLHSLGARGTTLNDKALTSTSPLSDGDIIEIAFTTLRFTTKAPSGSVNVAKPHSGQSDDYTRRATLESGVEHVVNENNTAGRSSRRIQALIALILLAAAAWWWFNRRP